MSPDGFGALLVAYSGILVLVVGLPFVASYLLDGVVQVLRNNGLKLFLGAVGMTVLVALVGYLFWRYGSTNASLAPSTLESMGTMAQMLLTFSTGLALIAFVSRTARLLWKSRRAAA
jgi:hypothetical protein